MRKMQGRCEGADKEKQETENQNPDINKQNQMTEHTLETKRTQRV